MAAPKDYSRDLNGFRFEPGGIDTVHPTDALPPNKFAYLQNQRGYKQLQIVGRATESAPVATLPSTAVTVSPSLTCTSDTWDSPTNATSTTLYASVVYEGGSWTLLGETSAESIPSTAVITGIGITCTAYSDIAGALLFGGISTTGTGGGGILHTLTITPTSYSYGGIGQLWGFVLTPAIINAGGLYAAMVAAGAPGPVTVYMNNLVVTVYYTTTTNIPHSLRILNDTTVNGPVGGYVRIIGAAGSMYVNSTQVATGLSGNPVSICPFRPNASVRPWAYIGDSSHNVSIVTKFAISGSSTTYPLSVTPTSYCFGSIKIQSDGLVYKTGIEEPQIAPGVSTQNYTTSGVDVLPATTIPWTNVGGANPTYNYGQSNASDGTAPVVITGGGPYLVAGSTVTLTVTGTAMVNGSVHNPGDIGPTTGSYPGSFIPGAKIVVGAFTDSSGNVVLAGGSLPLVFPVGASTTVTVPANATQLQIGIDSQANNFHLNGGSFSLAWSVTVSAISTVVSTVGQVTAYVWGTPPPTGGGSPHSGPVASYIWKNPNDGGSGTSRSITNPVPDASPTNNSWMFCSTATGTVDVLNDGPSTAVNWNVLNADGTLASTIPLYTPALESQGYQDFNACIVGNIFVPAAGTYTFSVTYKDQIMLGMGGGATLSGTVSTLQGSTTTTETGPFTGGSGQTITVINALPLMYVSKPDGGGAYKISTFSASFPGSGTYQVEIDWDYWYHTGRSLIFGCVQVTPNAPNIPPLPYGVRTGVQYRYVYRSSVTGALSNPSPESQLQLTPVLANEVTSIYSSDPQVDKVDYYRIDAGLDNFTYVATGPNDGLGGTIGGIVYNTPIEDELSDTSVTTNQILQYDNYEPFPIVDIPRKGIVNITGGVITWVSGDLFDTRWLPGTLIRIGYPTAIAYSFIARPISTTSVTIPEVPDGTNLVYEIPEPDLAAQPLPYIWGPTDNTAFMFGVGDPNNPGTLYFTKGNLPDSAPQTNQIAVTSPNEALINGVKTAAMGMVWTSERRWLIYPTFETALATVEGVAGTPFNVVEATGSRGLYIAPCVCTDGGMTAFFRAKDGIYVCEFGGQDKSITDDIYNLFPREGVVPQPITIAGNTIYPPDDTKPTAQKLAYGDGYLFYDYQDTTGTPRTLVYDQIAAGWSVDVGQYPFTVHRWEEGPETNTFMVGCSDGTVRVLGSGNPETCTSIVIPGAQNGGDARAFKRVGDVFIKALVVASNPVTVGLYANRYAQALAGFSPTSLVGTGSLSPYIVDFTSGYGDDLIDLGLSLSWPTASGNILDLWSPTLLPLPPATQDQPTDWDDGGYAGNKFVQGIIIEADSFNTSKSFKVERSDDNSLFTPNESPVIFNGQSIKPFTFTPPFIAHSMRIVSTDGVPWSKWGIKWVFEPYPESTIQWQTEFTSHDMMGWQHLREMNLAYKSTTTLTLTLVLQGNPTDVLPTITLTIPSSGGLETKCKTIIPANKFKLISYRLSAASPFTVFKERCESKIRYWGSSGPYSIIKPFGGEENLGAEV